LHPPDSCDARERGGAGFELAEELDRRFAPVLACREVDAASQEVLGIDAAAGRKQPAEAFDHQPRADQKYERKRNLRRGEKAPAGEASRAAGAGRLQAAALERAGQFRARGGERRREAEQDTGGKRRRGREEQGGPVQAHGAQRDQAVARKPPPEWVRCGRIDRGENVNSPGRERRTGERPERGEQHALGQELPNQAAAAGPDREPDRDLALARARKLQVGDVDASDQEHEPDGAEQDQHGTADRRVDAGFGEGPGPGPPRIAGGPVRVRFVDLFPEHLHGALGLGHRDAGAEACDDVVRMGPALGEVLGAERHGRHPDLRERGQAAETWGEHADDGVGAGVERDGRSHDGRVSAEAALPQTMAEERDRVRAGSGIFFRKERPADSGPDPQNREVVGSDDLTGDALRPLGSGQVERPALIGRGTFEDLLELPEGLELRVGPDHVIAGRFAVHRGNDERDLHEAVRLAERKRPQERGVDDAEDGRVRADPHGKRKDGDRREPGLLAQRAHAVAQVLKQRVHGSLLRLTGCFRLLGAPKGYSFLLGDREQA
jgi:hypothetical protein